MQDLASLCPAIDRGGYLYACPNAPLTFELGPGHVGYGRTPPRGEGTAEHAQRAVEMLETTFDEVMEQYHVAAGKVILMGFSQGGGMTYRCGLGSPETFAGLAALSSTMPEPEELEGRLPAPTYPAHLHRPRYSRRASARGARAEGRYYLEGAGYSPQYRNTP